MYKNFLKQKINVLIVVLSAIAILLGLFIYKGTKFPTLNISKNLPLYPSATPRVLTADEKDILKTPSTTATDKERKDFFDKALKLAKSAPSLNISGCYGNPIVIKVQQKQTLTVENPDPKLHSMVIDKDHIFDIPANGKKDIVVDFGRGPGLYGYGCDDSRDARGLFLVNQ